MQVRSGAGGALLAFTLVIALLAGCSGGSVSTTPVGPAVSGTSSATLSVATTGGFAPLPSINGMTGTVLVPPAIGASAPVPIVLTVSATQPSSVPAPPVGQALAYVTFAPTGTMNVPWYPQFNATFGGVPAGTQVVWYYYRLGTTTTQSQRQLARARRGEWLTARQVLADGISGTSSWIAPGGAGASGTAGVAGLSIGTLAVIGAGVVAVATIAGAASNAACGSACAPAIIPGTLNVAASATSTVSVKSTSATTYTAALQDCANAAGGIASAATIATVSPATSTVAAGVTTTFSLTGLATGTCSLSVSGSNGSSSVATTATIVVGAGAPIQGASASSFTSPSPSPSATSTATPAATASPTTAPTASPTPSPSATATATATVSSTPTPTASGGTLTTTNTIAAGAGALTVPAITGINGAKSSIAYPAPTGANGQTVYVTGSPTTNFAGLPTVSGRSAFMYFTAASSIGSALTFGSGSGLTFKLVGSALTVGQTYYVGYSLNGTTTGTVNPVTAIANGSEGEIDPITPFNAITMNADDIVGIVIAQ